MAQARLHLIKLSVGSESVDTLAAWQAKRLAEHGRLWHARRMMPRRRDELLDPAAPGSIYWVIRGNTGPSAPGRDRERLDGRGVE